jgi:hypothetical protein
MRVASIVVGLVLVTAIGCSSDRDGPTGDARANCGSLSCDGETQFCYDEAVGRVAAAVTTGCNTLPATCGATPSCACVMSNETFSCPQTPGCSVMDGAVEVVCGEP